jgi:hypothetical protein
VVRCEWQELRDGGEPRLVLVACEQVG